MRGRLRALLRLYAVQGAWNYERMLGVGMGYAAEPLLEELKRKDPARHAGAVMRSAEYFNSHPWLAGLALGAAVKAEHDGVPGEQIARLRTALCSPLGALGDQLFWAGLVPALMGAAIAAVVQGAGWWAVAVFLVSVNLIRARTAHWTLNTGLGAGMKVGAAMQASRLPDAAALAGSAAGFFIGLAVPLATKWFALPLGPSGLPGVLGIAAAGMVAGRLVGPRYAAPRFALLALATVLLYRWVTG